MSQGLPSPRDLQRCVGTVKRSGLNPFEPIGDATKTTHWSYVGPGRGSYEQSSTLYSGGQIGGGYHTAAADSPDLRPKGWVLFVTLVLVLGVGSWVSSRGKEHGHRAPHSFNCAGVSQEHWTKANAVWCCQHAGLGCAQDVAPGIDVPTMEPQKTGPTVGPIGTSTTVAQASSTTAHASPSMQRRTPLSTTPASSTSELAASFDCMQVDWDKGWSAAVAWCCHHENRGCPTYVTAVVPPDQYQYVFAGFGNASEARALCSARNGSRLAMPKTAAEHAAMQTALDSLKKANVLTQDWPNNTMWLGAHWDSKWLWDDGSMVGTHPSARKRLDHISSSSADEHAEPWLCMVLDGRWSDSLPNHPFGIMCEERTRSTVTLAATTTTSTVFSLPAPLPPPVSLFHGQK